jgi:GGDEF domain-containing protein
VTIVLFRFDNLPRIIATKPAEASRALLAIGTILKRRTRGMNLSARLADGHTFVSVLSGANEFGAEKFVAKVAKDLNSVNVSGRPLALRIGIASYEPDMADVDDLISRAERTLDADQGRFLSNQNVNMTDNAPRMKVS